MSTAPDSTGDAPHRLRPAEPRDVAAIVGRIRGLAEFEKLTHLLQVTPEKLGPHLFGRRALVHAGGADGGEGGARAGARTRREEGGERGRGRGEADGGDQ